MTDDAVFFCTPARVCILSLLLVLGPLFLAIPSRAQDASGVDSLAYHEEIRQRQEAQQAHLQALRARLAQQAAAQGPVSTTAPAATFTVNTTTDTDDGTCDASHCSLREAILAANTTTEADNISFNIGGGGTQTIAPMSALPAITEPVILDGETQGCANPPCIELDGSGAGAGADGLVVTGAKSTIRGLVINRFSANGIVFHGTGATQNRLEGNFIGTDTGGMLRLSNRWVGVLIQAGAQDNVVGGRVAAARNIISGNGQFGVEILNNGTTGNRVEGNFIGTNVTGTVGLSNRNDGVRIEGGPDENVIGGTGTGARNVISGNGADGVEIHGGTSIANRIEGNFIGTDVTGTFSIRNGHQGVVVQVNSFDNIIGGTTPGAGNVISGNAGAGVFMRQPTTSGTQVQGNFIGTDESGTAPLGNTSNGVFIGNNTFDNTIGGTTVGAGNIIAYNRRAGIRVLAAGTGNAILDNSTFINAQRGIDLDISGITLNDPGDADTGSNNLQNFPDIVDAFFNGGDLNVTYRVDSDPANATYPITVEFFEADVHDEEGQTLLGRDTFTAGQFNSGNNTLANLGSLTGLGVGDVLVVTATDANGNTSEFSPATTITTTVTRYVSLTGSDVGNNCVNPLNPCATLTHAAGQANPGDTIDLAAGTYAEPGLVIEKNLIIQGAGVVVQ